MDQVNNFTEHISHAHSLVLATISNFFILLSFIFISFFFLRLFNIPVLEVAFQKYLFDKSPPPKKKYIRSISNPRSPPKN